MHLHSQQLRRLQQEEYLKFEDSMGNLVRPHLKKIKQAKTKQTKIPRYQDFKKKETPPHWLDLVAGNNRG